MDVKNIVGEGAPLFIYCSPYMRTKQTLHGMMKGLEGSCSIIGAREEPQLTGLLNIHFKRYKLRLHMILNSFYRATIRQPTKF